jgi:hypothetical protein
MKAIIEEGSPETGQKMQMLALAEGAVPIHLVKALYIKSEDNRLLMQRQLSRHLISLWTADNDAAIELLQRILVSQCKISSQSESHNTNNIALQNSVRFPQFYDAKQSLCC